MVLVVDADLGLGVGIPHDDVGVATGGDDALLRIHAEHTGRGGAAGLDPALEREFAGDHALIDEFHTVLHTADAVGDLGEVTQTEFFLILEAERTVIGGDHREFVHAQALPEIALVAVAHLADVMRIVITRAHGCTAHPLRAFEAGLAEGLLEREPQILRAGLGEHVASVVAGGRDFVERVTGRHVHDVERNVAGDVRQDDGPVGGFGFER